MDDDLLKNCLSVLGIKEGDIVDVSSDLMSLFFYARKRSIVCKPEHLLNDIEDMVSESGTVMHRVFNWDFCHGKTFDIRSTRSQVGELGNAALNRVDYRRTAHPIYSWMVKGTRAEELCNMSNCTSFGEDSPWKFLETHGAKMLVLGNTNDFGLTCLHYIEQECGVDYRYEKQFDAEYIDESGEKTNRRYSMYVRKLDRQVLFNKENAMKRLCEREAMHIMLLDNYLTLAVLDYKKTCALIREDFLMGEGSYWVSVTDLEENRQ